MTTTIPALISRIGRRGRAAFAASCLLILAFVLPAAAATFRLRYKPSGHIVRLVYGKLAIFTDSTALSHPRRGKALQAERIRGTLAQHERDTTTFYQGFGTGNSADSPRLFMEPVILALLQQRKLQVFDGSGLELRRIRMRHIGHPQDDYFAQVYYDPKSGAELCRRVLRIVLTTPKF